MHSLSRGDHTDGMMVGYNPISFLPFHLGANTRSQGRVGKWLHNCWKISNQVPGPKQEWDWGGLPLKEVNQNNMFELKNMKATRLWMPPPHSYGGGHGTLLGGQIGAAPMAPYFCCTSFHDSFVEEKFGEIHRHNFHCASRGLFWRSVAV